MWCQIIKKKLTHFSQLTEMPKAAMKLLETDFVMTTSKVYKCVYVDICKRQATVV